MSQFNLGEYVKVLPGSECHPDVVGWVGRIIDQPVSLVYTVDFGRSTPQMKDYSPEWNRGMDGIDWNENCFMFYDHELERSHPLIEAIREVQEEIKQEQEKRS